MKHLTFYIHLSKKSHFSVAIFPEKLFSKNPNETDFDAYLGIRIWEEKQSTYKRIGLTINIILFKIVFSLEKEL